MTTLKDMTEKDLENVTKWRNDPDINRYLTLRVRTKDEADFWFKRSKSNRKNWIKIILYDNKPVGYALVEDVDMIRRKCEFVIIIGAKDLWGKGVGITVIKEMLKYCFEDLKLHRALAVIDGGNKRSIKLFEKSGFIHEGTLRDAMYIDGQFSDLLCYSMLENEYKALAT